MNADGGDPQATVFMDPGLRRYDGSGKISARPSLRPIKMAMPGTACAGLSGWI
jgi:hypothetical protein